MPKCYKHNRIYVSLCSWCGKSICEDCMPVKGRKYCEPCFLKLPPEHRLSPKAEAPLPPPDKKHFIMRGDE